jgi:hypothetical protein
MRDPIKNANGNVVLGIPGPYRSISEHQIVAVLSVQEAEYLLDSTISLQPIQTSQSKLMNGTRPHAVEGLMSKLHGFAMLDISTERRSLLELQEQVAPRAPTLGFHLGVMAGSI